MPHSDSSASAPSGQPSRPQEEGTTKQPTPTPSQTSRSPVSPASCPPGDKSIPIDVIVTCHDRYLDWLPGCLESIDAQGTTGGHVVVFDGCEPPKWLSQKPSWRVLRGNWRNPNQARNAGLAVTSSPWVVWLDADNQMPPGYLRAYQQQIATVSHKVGVVYPDLQDHDEQMWPTRLWEKGDYDYWRLRKVSYIDTASCWRRAAVQAVGGWKPVACMDDWTLAMALTREGWSGEHARGPAVWMRKHSRSQRRVPTQKSPQQVINKWPVRSLAVLTLLGPDRAAVHPRWLAWLAKADLPPLTELVLVDNRGVHDRQLLHAAGNCRSWTAVTVIQDAGIPTGTGWHEVHEHVARLYRRALRKTNADMVFTLEDDVEPPLEAVRLLYEAFPANSSVGACGGLYVSPSRPGQACAALDPERWVKVPFIKDWPAKPAAVGAIGGGCTLYAGWALREAGPIEVLEHSGWDGTLCQRLRKAGYSSQMDGRVFCVHHAHGTLNPNERPYVRTTPAKPPRRAARPVHRAKPVISAPTASPPAVPDSRWAPAPGACPGQYERVHTLEVKPDATLLVTAQVLATDRQGNGCAWSLEFATQRPRDLPAELIGPVRVDGSDRTYGAEEPMWPSFSGEFPGLLKLRLTEAGVELWGANEEASTVRWKADVTIVELAVPADGYPK